MPDTVSAPASAAAAPSGDARPALPWYLARSSYAAIAAVVSAALLLAGDPEAAEQARADIPDQLQALAGVALALWAYAERLFGAMRITL